MVDIYLISLIARFFNFSNIVLTLYVLHLMFPSFNSFFFQNIFSGLHVFSERVLFSSSFNKQQN